MRVYVIRHAQSANNALRASPLPSLRTETSPPSPASHGTPRWMSSSPAISIPTTALPPFAPAPQRALTDHAPLSSSPHPLHPDAQSSRA